MVYLGISRRFLMECFGARERGDAVFLKAMKVGIEGWGGCYEYVHHERGCLAKRGRFATSLW